MIMDRSRNHRSPNHRRRSRSRSNQRRTAKSRSRERYKSSRLSPFARSTIRDQPTTLKRDNSKALRQENDASIRPISGTTFTNVSERALSNADRSTTNNGNLSGVAPSLSGRPSPISLNDRFTRMTSMGTAIYNRRRAFGRASAHDRRYVPHLILTNNTKLPPATLLRQAKAISIVIDRKFPPGWTNKTDAPGDLFDPKRHVLTIPRRPQEGWRPVFDRPGIHLFTKSSEEVEITDRLLQVIDATLRSRSQAGGKSTGGRSVNPYNDTIIVGPASFYGSNVGGESVRAARSAHSLDPRDTPRGPSYFMHDDRGDRADYYSESASRHDYSSRRRSPLSPNRHRSARQFEPHKMTTDELGKNQPNSQIRANEENRWLHDKFEPVVVGTSGQQASKPVPKPVPAPKPILWSTIGKEVNTEMSTSHSRDDYTPEHSPTPGSQNVECGTTVVDDPPPAKQMDQPTAGDEDEYEVRIDIEPAVLDETMEQHPSQQQSIEAMPIDA